MVDICTSYNARRQEPTYFPLSCFLLAQQSPKEIAGRNTKHLKSHDTKCTYSYMTYIETLKSIVSSLNVQKGRICAHTCKWCYVRIWIDYYVQQESPEPKYSRKNLFAQIHVAYYFSRHTPNSRERNCLSLSIFGAILQLQIYINVVEGLGHHPRYRYATTSHLNVTPSPPPCRGKQPVCVPWLALASLFSREWISSCTSVSLVCCTEQIYNILTQVYVQWHQLWQRTCECITCIHYTLSNKVKLHSANLKRKGAKASWRADLVC